MLFKKFFDRLEAGKELSFSLLKFKGEDVLVLAVPRGGVPVGFEVAKALKVPLDVIVSRKIPIPWNTEAGFGAVAPDGTLVLNEPLTSRLGLDEEEIDRLAKEVEEEIRRREKIYRGERPFPTLEGKIVIPVDDGLASGITMLAALRFIKKQKPEKVIVAIPVASGSAVRLLSPEVDELISLYIHPEHLSFAVASFYQHWRDLTDEEVKEYLAAYITNSSF